MKKQRQVLAVLMAGMMMAGILGGCGQKAEPEPEKKEEVQKEEAENKNKFPYLVKVTANILNVRAGAGTNYKITTQIRKNQVYTIVDQKGKWGKLKSGAGWICLDYT